MNWEAITFLVGGVIQAATFAFFLGAMNARLHSVEDELKDLRKILYKKLEEI